MNGMVSGGWEYVIAAYVVTLATLVFYGASVWIRYRGEGEAK